MDGADPPLKFKGTGTFNAELLLGGCVVAVVKPIGKRKFYIDLEIGGEAVRIVQNVRLGTRSRRTRPGRPTVREDD